MWLWASQNAFLSETNPATGVKWDDRHGLVYGKGFRKHGNIETHLAYKKLHRTGRLLKSLKARGTVDSITLSSNVPYASIHEEGGNDGGRTIKGTHVGGGATGALLGGNIVARPFMKPSQKILRGPQRLIEEKMKEFGWKVT